MSKLLVIYLRLSRLVLFLDIYSLIRVDSTLDVVMPIFGVTWVILVTMKQICVLIMHVMVNLTSHHVGTILMLS